MQTSIDAKALPAHLESQADAALRSCVHCGFCNATCPTYQLTGNELDSPRGRIYLIKQALEGGPTTQLTQRHLDRCLTCTACESTCPSGVEYHTLLGIGREFVDGKVPRPAGAATTRRLLRAVASRTWLFRLSAWLGRQLRPLLPPRVRALVPTASAPLPQSERTPPPAPRTDGPVIGLLAGCVHPVLAPATQEAAKRVLERLGMRVMIVSGVGCCGALHHHFGDPKGARERVQRRVARLDRLLTERGVHHFVSAASGCSAFMRDYPALLADPHSGEIPAAAERVGAALRDIAEVIEPSALAALVTAPRGDEPLQMHCPCTLEHGLHLAGRVQQILRASGLEVSPDPHAGSCCGSAGAWSVLEPQMAKSLGQRRAQELEQAQASTILTANVGCQQHLSRYTRSPLRHWIEEVEARTRPSAQGGDVLR